MPEPQSKEDVKRLLRFVQFLSRYLPSLSTVESWRSQSFEKIKQLESQVQFTQSSEMPVEKGLDLCATCMPLNHLLTPRQGVQRGKLDIQQVRDNGFHCQSVSFDSSFNSGTPVRVFASINHGNESSTVHDTAFIWVEDVTTSRFKACLVQGGQGAGGNTTIDWFAFQGSQSGVYHGGASFSLFTTGTQCNRVAFPQVFSVVPKVHVTVHHGTIEQKQDAMSVWIASVSTSQFEVCLHESRTFDGPHSKLMVNWMAYEQYPMAWEAKESSENVFSEKEIPTADNNHALCNFVNPFYAPPVVLTTVINGGSNNANKACQVKGPLSSWLELFSQNCEV
ncbi:hypothetical protein OS493_020098 [Desmophyllum pertusum]|uniref:H-type lectin domain-containing protein n=1 Tax=Desmophyllum pertusum TaxID=174260 RepID=A0A9X0D9Z9_9CNID|nr:hypothetical protein OS493_020098 [Desmophyllum pertusum]